MPRPILPTHEKRKHEVAVAYNDTEYTLLVDRARDAGKSLAPYIRETSLSDECIQIVTPEGKKAGKRVREIANKLNELYYCRMQALEKLGAGLRGVSQNNSESKEDVLTEREAHMWRAISDELRQLNAELLGYADNDD